MVNTLDPAAADRELIRYLTCVLGDKRDPDMQGFAVRLSSLVINVCLAILIKWSDVDIAGSVASILLTVFSLLLCTFVSLIQKQLSVADGHFALSITISPLAVYLIYASIRSFFNKETLIFANLNHKTGKLVKIFSYTLLLIWIILDILIYFWPNKLFAEGGCGKITVRAWLVYRFFMTGTKLAIPLALTLPTIPVWFLIYTIRHWRDIRGEMKRHMDNLHRWKRFTWLQTTLRTIQFYFLSGWVVIISSHSWIKFWLICLAYVTWAGSLMIWVVDIQTFLFEIAVSIGQDAQIDIRPPPNDYDPAGFGQLLAATCALQPLYAVIQLAWTRRWQLIVYFKNLPGLFWQGLVFIFTGRGNPWPEVAERRYNRKATREASLPYAYEATPFVLPPKVSGQDDPSYAMHQVDLDHHTYTHAKTPSRTSSFA